MGLQMSDAGSKKKKILNTSLKSKSVVENIIDKLTEAIIAGELKPGDRLPTETELSESFHVGRNSVREAIKVLAAFGVVHIRRADGTFVSDQFSHRMLDPMLYGIILEKDSIREIMELRQVFDTGILQVAVEKATKRDIKAIEAALENLKREIFYDQASASRVLDADIAFHKAVILSADNVLIWQIAGYIDRLTIPSRVRAMQLIIDLNRKEDFIRLHERLLEIIRDRCPEDIPQAVEDHYQYWRRESADGPSKEMETP